MPTLMYSPAVRVRISTAKHGVLDVSADLINGSLTISTGGNPSNFSFSLNNYRRKYDGVFTPNDRIVVSMKRIKWLQVFSGYLDEVPFFSIYPRNVQLAASDTLKRLKYFTWDPGSGAAFQLLHGASESTQAKEVDGGLRNKAIALLTDVAGWPKGNIHIGGLPKQWFDTVTKVQAQYANQWAVPPQEDGLGTTPSVAGQTTTPGATTIAGVGPYTGVLPNPTTGKASWFGGPSGGAYGNMALSGESGVSPRDPWYAAMRFPYQGYVNGRITRHGTSAETRAAINWWKNQRLIVTAPSTGKSIVVRCADWGPGGVATADDRCIDLSKQGLAALGVPTDGIVSVRFATPTTPLGPTTVVRDTGVGSRAAVQARQEGNATTNPPSVTTGSAGRAAPGTTQGGSQMQAAGLRFVTEDRLQPHVNAARQFIRLNWSQAKEHGIGGYGYRSNPTDHSTGHALDVMVCKGGTFPNATEKAYGNAVASWFISNPEAFGTKYVIWQGKIISRGRKEQGWRPYTHPSGSGGATLGHFDHPHISFEKSSQTTIGPMGSPWPGAAEPPNGGDFNAGAGFTPGSDDSTGGALPGGALFNIDWMGREDPLSTILSGPRLLLNDTYLMPTIQQVMGASMRDFMAAPNGDFMAWFPDYFGFYGQAGRLHIADIELVGDGFTMQWSDRSLITHQFTAGAAVGYSTSLAGEVVDETAKYQTMGIASVEYPEIMKALFNVDPNSPAAAGYFNKDAVLKRFGARTDYVEMGTITGPIAEFWYALKLFQESWAQQFSCSVNLTFMPEVWPGMLLVLDSYKFQCYVTSVSHNFDLGEGGGFTTSVTVTAPSSLDGGGLYGLPRGTGAVAKPKPATKDD